jgi:hypothetical protein
MSYFDDQEDSRSRIPRLFHSTGKTHLSLTPFGQGEDSRTVMHETACGLSFGENSGRVVKKHKKVTCKTCLQFIKDKNKPQSQKPDSMSKPHITYTISEDRTQLILSVDSDTQKQLVELRDDEEKLREVFTSDLIWGTTICECEILEQMIANSELQFLDAADTSDLTGAPILGIYDLEENKSRVQSGPHGASHIGGDTGGAWYLPIVERWGYPNYQIRTFLDDLADKGEAVFIDRW